MTWTNLPTECLKEVEKELAECVRDISVNIVEDLVRISPVDTGKFRGAWVVGIKNKNNEIPTNVNSGSTVINKAKSELSGLNTLEDVIISNNLPYARSLNDGSSDKAPANFVQSAAIRAGNR